MSEIIITTSGEVKLSGDVLGQIKWLRPFVESDVAGEYSQDDPFVDEWGCCIDCMGCDEKDVLLRDLFEANQRVKKVISECRAKLEKSGTLNIVTSNHLAEISALIGNMEFDT